MSVQCCSMYRRHSAFVPDLPTERQPAGTVRSAGQIDHWSSWFTTTLNTASSLSKMLITTPSNQNLSRLFTYHPGGYGASGFSENCLHLRTLGLDRKYRYVKIHYIRIVHSEHDARYRVCYGRMAVIMSRPPRIRSNRRGDETAGQPRDPARGHPARCEFHSRDRAAPRTPARPPRRAGPRWLLRAAGPAPAAPRRSGRGGERTRLHRGDHVG